MRSTSRNPSSSCRPCRARSRREVSLRNGCRTGYQQHSPGQVRRQSRADPSARAVAGARRRRFEDRLRTLGTRSGGLRTPVEPRGRRQLPRRGLGVDGMHGEQQPEGRSRLRPGPAGQGRPNRHGAARRPGAALCRQGGIHRCYGSTAEKPCPGRLPERQGGDSPVLRAEGRPPGGHDGNRRTAAVARGGSAPGRRFRKNTLEYRPPHAAPGRGPDHGAVRRCHVRCAGGSEPPLSSPQAARSSSYNVHL